MGFTSSTRSLNTADEDLAPHIEDRLTRYEDGEPLKDIAKDHKVTTSAIIDTVKRYRPELIGFRARGPLPNWVHDRATIKKSVKEPVSGTKTKKAGAAAPKTPRARRSRT